MSGAVIAHRGLSARLPENSLAAVAAALDHTQAIEIDVRATSDCVLVCTHDATLQRCHGDDRRVGEVTFGELATIAPDVPRLEDVLSHHGPAAGWFLDCKVTRPRTIDELINVVERCGLAWTSRAAIRAGELPEPGTCVFESADHGLLASWRDRTGGACVELITGKETAARLGVTAPLISAYANGVVIPERLATKRMLRLLTSLRLGSYVYTVNDLTHARELLDAGASGVFTDIADEFGA
jgi:glycerophosphoryl diester phosphodiesterase